MLGEGGAVDGENERTLPALRKACTWVSRKGVISEVPVGSARERAGEERTWLVSREASCAALRTDLRSCQKRIEVEMTTMSIMTANVALSPVATEMMARTRRKLN